jgi:hypothetical protein
MWSSNSTPQIALVGPTKMVYDEAPLNTQSFRCVRISQATKIVKEFEPFLSPFLEFPVFDHLVPPVGERLCPAETLHFANLAFERMKTI